MTAHLIAVNSDYASDAELIGTTTVENTNGWFNFTDLGVSHAGEYQIQFMMSEPDAASHLRYVEPDAASHLMYVEPDAASHLRYMYRDVRHCERAGRDEPPQVRHCE